MTDVTVLLDDFDLVAAQADGVADPGEVQAAAEAAKALRQRSGFIGDTLVVALAGGTGSGKSSVLNAIAGVEIASVSPVRPHTDFPLAWVPSDAGPGLERMLEELSIYERATHDAFPGLAILDLPDIDSIVEWHRTVVEDLLPRIDAVIWLFDPEKYRDPMLHEDFLQRLSRHGDQFLFVLNKVDRIARDELDAVVADLTIALREDGYEAPRIFPIAAAPPEAAPIGVDTLARHLSNELDGKRMAAGKLLGDVRAAAERLGADAVVLGGASVDFEERWSRIATATAEGMTPGSGRAAVQDALCRIEDFIALVSVQVGTTFGTRIRSTFTPERIEGDLEAVLEAATVDDRPTSRRWRRKKVAEPDRVAATAELERRIGDPLREFLRERAVFGASLTTLAVTSAQVEARLKSE